VGHNTKPSKTEEKEGNLNNSLLIELRSATLQSSNDAIKFNRGLRSIVHILLRSAKLTSNARVGIDHSAKQRGLNKDNDITTQAKR
jgi:hypothetical protein